MGIVRILAEYVVPMLAASKPLLLALWLTAQFSLPFASSVQSSASSIAVSSEPWSKACIPFSEEDVASANLTDSEKLILPDLCYQPDLTPHLFETQDERGIPPGVDCTPVQWCVSCMGALQLPYRQPDMLHRNLT